MAHGTDIKGTGSCGMGEPTGRGDKKAKGDRLPYPGRNPVHVGISFRPPHACVLRNVHFSEGHS